MCYEELPKEMRHPQYNIHNRRDEKYFSSFSKMNENEDGWMDGINMFERFM